MTPHQANGKRRGIRQFLAGVIMVLIALALCGVTYSVFYQGTGQIVSNEIVGPPFVVESTTLVPNLNADYLNSQSGAYYNDSPGRWSCSVAQDSCSCATPGCTCGLRAQCSAGQTWIWFSQDQSTSGIWYTVTFDNQTSIYCQAYDIQSTGSAATACYILCCS